MNNKQSSLESALLSVGRWVATCAFTLVFSGCYNYYPIIFVDELAKAPPVTTPSAARAGELPARETPVLTRAYPEVKAPSVDGAVVHGPLYFEDPFETHGSRDGKFAWTYEDYLAIFYGDARWLINTAAIPASLVFDPPTKAMESGGDRFRHATLFHVKETNASDRPKD